MPLFRAILVPSAIAAFALVGIVAPKRTAANEVGYCPCFADGIAPICSPLDTPLRWYFIPRRPADGPNDYCYHVRGPRDCPPCDANGQPVPAELVEEFSPLEFERLGHIPGDHLLEAASSGGR